MKCVLASKSAWQLGLFFWAAKEAENARWDSNWEFGGYSNQGIDVRISRADR